MSKIAHRKLCALAVTGAISGFSLISTANASIVGSFTPGNYLESGSVTNSHSANLVGVIIDLLIDAGLAGPGTPVWDTNAGSAGNPPGNFSNAAPDTADSFFTVAFLGLDIPDGNSFNYSGLDYDGYTGTANNTSGENTPLDGSETATILYADGTSISANLPAGDPLAIPTVLFDSTNLVGTRTLLAPPVNTVPVPAALPLLATGFGFIGVMGWRRKRIVRASS